jgi:hypothetical protein
MVSSFDFDAAIANNWVIKKMHDYLYLLLPKKYLQERGIRTESVQVFAPDGPISATEQALGLKINHVETVPVASIQSPEEAPEFANYFIDSLDAIFVKTGEYSHQVAIPQLALFIDGHGSIDTAVCSLTIQQFKKFLNFLEKLPTQLLVYSSCYGAGTNQKLLYRDAMRGVDRTYTFTIITMALTDAPTSNPFVALDLDNQGKLVPVPLVDYACFITAVTQSDIPEYSDAIRCIDPLMSEINIPQIRYPGLPWFSILEYPRVASIGSVMAKSRTTPLDIAKFFAKNAKQKGLASPYVILLYDQYIPFELIVNTHDEDGCYMPLIVSMIPGDQIHYIKKISSSCNLVHDILKSFYLDQMAWRKLFIIDEITAPWSTGMSALLTQGQAKEGTLTNVIVEVTENRCTQYFTYNSQVYVSTGCLADKKEESMDSDLKLANADQKQVYYALLRRYHKASLLTPEAMARVRAVQAQKATTLQQSCP